MGLNLLLNELMRSTAIALEGRERKAFNKITATLRCEAD